MSQKLMYQVEAYSKAISSGVRNEAKARKSTLIALGLKVYTITMFQKEEVPMYGHKETNM
jgi:hypothetical protein